MWLYFLVFIIVFALVSIFISKKTGKIKRNETEECFISDVEAEVINNFTVSHQENLIEEQNDKLIEGEKGVKHNPSKEELEKTNNYIVFDHSEPGNPYEILGVHKCDSMEIISNIHQKLLQVYLPYTTSNTPATTKIHKQYLIDRINAAYNWMFEHHNQNE